MTDTKMKDKDLDVMIQAMRNGPHMGRLQTDEIRESIRALEVAGYTVTAPAPKDEPKKSIFGGAGDKPIAPESMTTAQQVAADKVPEPSTANAGLNPAPKTSVAPNAATPA